MKACARSRATPTRRSTSSTRSQARRAADLGYTLCRIKWLVATRQDRRRRPPGGGGGAGDHGAAGHRRMVARAAQPRPQTARSATSSRPPMMSCAARRCRRTNITAPISISCPAGSRCATSTIPRRRARISPISTRARPIRSCWRGRTTGAAASPKRLASRTRCARATKRPRAIPPPITASLRARKLGLDTDRVARARRKTCPMRPQPRTNACAPPRCSMRSASATSCCISRPISREQSKDIALLAALGELTGRRNDARTMLQIGKTGARPRAGAGSLRLPDHRDTAAQPDRPRDRAQHHLFGGAHRKRVRPARQVAGQCGRPDAGHSGSRARHRKTVRRQLRLGSDGLRSRLQHADGRGRTQGAAARVQAAPTS